MAGFRNVLVHVYADVNLAIVEQAATEGLEDFKAFIVAIRAKI